MLNNIQCTVCKLTVFPKQNHSLSGSHVRVVKDIFFQKKISLTLAMPRIDSSSLSPSSSLSLTDTDAHLGSENEEGRKDES